MALTSAQTQFHPRRFSIGKFWSRVVKTETCWNWTGPTTRGGYGRTGFRKHRSVGTHRISWTLANGEIPEGLCVLHHCDNPPCVRPDHLFLGTIAENNRDRGLKGRGFAFHGDNHPARIRSGERHWSAKVSDQQVSEMRVLRSAGATLSAIASRFGLDASYVSRITRWGRRA